MMETIFRGVFDTEYSSILSITGFLACVASSIIIGFIIAVMYMYKSSSSKSFVATLATLPAVVCVVIMMVNGNVGAGVAVAGTFSLVRFRSVPGTAKEIGALFLAMGAGLLTGMGYIAFAVLFVVVMGLVNMLYARFDFGARKLCARNKTMHVTIPEDLDYTEIFDDIFDRFTEKSELIHVKTTNMGSLFRLTYNLTFKEEHMEKAFIDEVRYRNGNLEVAMSNQGTPMAEL